MQSSGGSQLAPGNAPSSSSAYAAMRLNRERLNRERLGWMTIAISKNRPITNSNLSSFIMDLCPVVDRAE